MLTASQIIDRLGGTSAVASALDLTPSVVTSWRSANSIPRWWRAGVVAIEPVDGGAPVTVDDFPLSPAEIARAERRAA